MVAHSTTNVIYFQDTEDELKRLKHEMKRITMMYNIVCQESDTATDKVCQLQLC